MGWANARVTALIQGKRQVKVHELPQLSRFLRMPTLELVGHLTDGDIGFVPNEAQDAQGVNNGDAPQLSVPQNETFLRARRLIKAALEFKAEVSGRPLPVELLEEHATLVTHAFIALGWQNDGIERLDLDSALDTINAIKAIRPRS